MGARRRVFKELHCSLPFWKRISFTIATFVHKVDAVSSTCFFHLRRLRQIRYIISTSMKQRLVSAFVLSRLDYCNSVFAGLPDTTPSPFQRTLNAVIRPVAGLGLRDPDTASMRELHWLLISFRIDYKLRLVIHALL